MIRRALEKDIDAVHEMLLQVLKVHSDLRPDIFIEGSVKYSNEELSDIFRDDERPVFVWTDENDVARGYVFCIFNKTENCMNMHDRKTLYIDDLCVDEKYRRKHIAGELYAFVRQFAKENHCDSITLNVWAGNDNAALFYKAEGLKPMKTVMEEAL